MLSRKGNSCRRTEVLAAKTEKDIPAKKEIPARTKNAIPSAETRFMQPDEHLQQAGKFLKEERKSCNRFHAKETRF